MNIISAMTEDQIERRVERMVDRLDKQYMGGEITEKEYSLQMRLISSWADTMYKASEKARKIN